MYNSSSIKEVGSLQVMCLPDADILTSLPAISYGIVSKDYTAAMSLFEEYADLFSKVFLNIGPLKGTQNMLDLEEVLPFQAQSYHKFKFEEAQVAINLKQLLNYGLLKPSESPWDSLLLLLKKNDGVYRVVMDYENLNSITKKDI